jgi:hypothetical protein
VSILNVEEALKTLKKEGVNTGRSIVESHAYVVSMHRFDLDERADRAMKLYESMAVRVARAYDARTYAVPRWLLAPVPDIGWQPPSRLKRAEVRPNTRLAVKPCVDCDEPTPLAKGVDARSPRCRPCAAEHKGKKKVDRIRRLFRRVVRICDALEVPESDYIRAQFKMWPEPEPMSEFSHRKEYVVPLPVHLTDTVAVERYHKWAMVKRAERISERIGDWKESEWEENDIGNL